MRVELFHVLKLWLKEFMRCNILKLWKMEKKSCELLLKKTMREPNTKNWLKIDNKHFIYLFKQNKTNRPGDQLNPLILVKICTTKCNFLQIRQNFMPL